MKTRIEITGTDTPQVVVRAINEYFNEKHGSCVMPREALYEYRNGKLIPHADGDEPITVKIETEG